MAVPRGNGNGRGGGLGGTREWGGLGGDGGGWKLRRLGERKRGETVERRDYMMEQPAFSLSPHRPSPSSHQEALYTAYVDGLGHSDKGRNAMRDLENLRKICNRPHSFLMNLRRSVNANAELGNWDEKGNCDLTVSDDEVRKGTGSGRWEGREAGGARGRGGGDPFEGEANVGREKGGD